MDWAKEWGPLATAALATTGALASAYATIKAAAAAAESVNVSKQIGDTQRELMQRQLRQDLFPRRLAAYETIQRFAAELDTHTGFTFAPKTPYAELIATLDEIGFLFGNATRAKVEEYRHTAIDLSTKAKERDLKREAGETAAAEVKAVSHLIKALKGPILSDLNQQLQTLLQIYQD